MHLWHAKSPTWACASSWILGAEPTVWMLPSSILLVLRTCEWKCGSHWKKRVFLWGFVVVKQLGSLVNSVAGRRGGALHSSLGCTIGGMWMLCVWLKAEGKEIPQTAISELGGWQNCCSQRAGRIVPDTSLPCRAVLQTRFSFILVSDG